MSGSAPRPRVRVAPVVDAVQSIEIYRLRALLASLEDLSIAALLRELGVVLYNREIMRWRVLTEISDELIDLATSAARRRIVDRALAETKAPLAKAAARLRR